MRPVIRDRGFTLLELLVAMAIVGILASTASSAYVNYRLTAKATAAYEELRGLRSAMFAYMTENINLPTDVVAGVIPAGMQKFVAAGIFDQDTPVGGTYNWEGPPTHDPNGFSIEGQTVPLWVMIDLDERVDDGDLGSGAFQLTNFGRFMIIVDL